MENLNIHDRGCRFGLAARLEEVRRRYAGETFRLIAASMACSPIVRNNCLRWEQADVPVVGTAAAGSQAASPNQDN